MHNGVIPLNTIRLSFLAYTTQYFHTYFNQWPVGRTITLQCRHDGHDSVSNDQPHDSLPNRLFRRESKKISKLRVTGLCAGNSPETGKFPAQMASNGENVSIWWRHHDKNTTLLGKPAPGRSSVIRATASPQNTPELPIKILPACQCDRKSFYMSSAFR